MEQSTTGQVVDTSVADNSSTTEPTTNPAEQSTQELTTSNSGETTVQDSSANTTNNEQDTEALTKFAKGQGINDLSELSERELSLLKMARDNKSAFDKSKQHQPILDESSKELAALGDDATDIQKLSAKVAGLEFHDNKVKFLEGKDATLEPVMGQIVADARKELGDDYARSLINNLPFLYKLASLNKTTDTSAVIEAAKQEERNSINKSLSAGASDAHAISSKPQTPIKVTSEWIRNEYNPSNPEHRALVDALTKK